MTDGRRAFLEKLSLAAATLGSTSLAGCVSETPLASGSAMPDYAGWLYDPSPLMSVDNQVYATFDVQSLYENRDLLPAGLFETFDALDTSLESVDVEALGSTTMLAYSKFDPAGWSTNPESGLSLAVEGSFDAESIASELRDIEGVADAGTHGEYDLHTTSFDWDLGSFGEHTATLSMATGDAALVVGLTFDLEEDKDPLDAVTLPIDANAGDADTVTDASDDAGELVSAIGETTFGIAFDVRKDLLDNSVDDDNTELDDAAKEVVGIGLDLDFDDDDLRGDTILVFDDEAAADETDVEGLLADSDQSMLEDATVSTDGRVTTITSKVDAEALWESYWPNVELGASDDTDE